MGVLPGGTGTAISNNTQMCSNVTELTTVLMSLKNVRLSSSLNREYPSKRPQFPLAKTNIHDGARETCPILRALVKLSDFQKFRRSFSTP
jgi:hypothetical protein